MLKCLGGNRPAWFVLWGGAMLCALIYLSVPGHAHAQAPVTQTKVSPLRVQLAQFRVDPASNEMRALVDSAKVAPGDIVEYRAIYSNHGVQALTATAVLPIPEGMVYVPRSASQPLGLHPQMAQRDQQYAPEPLQKSVIDAAGAAVLRPVPYADYRFLQWELGSLAPGASIQVGMRARLDAVAQPKDRQVPAE